MQITLCKAKLHRLRVTQAELHYEGSITIDQDLLDAAGIVPFERVQVVDITNGERFETYTYGGVRGSGVVCLNGAAARRVHVGDLVIVIAYAEMTPEEAATHCPTLALIGEDNTIKEIVHDIAQPVLHEHDHEC